MLVFLMRYALNQSDVMVLDYQEMAGLGGRFWLKPNNCTNNQQEIASYRMLAISSRWLLLGH
jgi:hypothetical protein